MRWEIAGPYVLPDALHGGHVVLGRPVRAHLQLLRGLEGEGLEVVVRVAEGTGPFFQICHGSVVQLVGIVSLLHRDRGHRQGPIEEVVHRQHSIGEEEAGVRTLEVGRRRMREILQPAHHVVAEEAHGAAPEPGEAVHRDGLVPGHQSPEVLERFARGASVEPSPVGGPAGDPLSLELPRLSRARAQEAVASPTLSTDHGFQEEAEGRAAKLGVCSNRRLRVEWELDVDGD